MTIYQTPMQAKVACYAAMLTAPQWARDMAAAVMNECTEVWELAESIGDHATAEEWKAFAARRVDAWRDARWHAIPPPGIKEQEYWT